MLKIDDRGAAVKALQTALKAAGFDPGKIDGDFGHGTEAALIAFQKSEKLTPDGIAGSDTMAALKLPPPPEPSSDIAKKVTPRSVSQMFPSTPLGNIIANLPFVLKAMQDANLADKAMILMALGTICAETESFEPISEGQSRFNTSPRGHPFDLYDNRKDLGNRGVPDGASYRGRGFVQLTGRFNYAKFGPKLTPSADLVNHPELGNDPTTASALLALFLKDKEKAIRAALKQDDLAAARKLVNGGSHGLESFTRAYRVGQRVLPD